MNPYGLVLEQAPAALQERVWVRLDARVREALLESGTLPGDDLVEYVVAHGAAGDRAALAANPGAWPELLMALAEGADGAVAFRLFDNPGAPREAMLRVLGLLPADGLLPAGRSRLHGTREIRRISVAVETDDPDLTVHALSLLDPDYMLVTPAVVLRGYLGMMRAAERGSASRARVDPWFRDSGYPRLVRDALDDPSDTDRLVRALDLVGRTSSVSAELRTPYRRRDDHIAALHAPRAPLDWDLLVAEHRREPFAGAALEALTLQIGCPEELRTPVTPHGRALYRSLRDAIVPGLARAKLIRQLGSLESLEAIDTGRIENGHETGVLSAAAILRHGAPALAALRLFQDAAGDRLADARRALHTRARDRLGAVPDAWVVVLNLLPDFPGTVQELLDTAKAITA